ncbi:MAG TPA: hypothetical protein PKK60_00245 [archaeon]|nr:hypothetical protein [archaeon]
MIPEAELIRKEVILRKMDFPASVSLTKNSLLRWCALSTGFISPKESRDKGLIILDALFVLLFTKKENPTTLEIQSYIKEKTKADFSEKLIRYHLNRLIDLGTLSRDGLKYKINPAPNSDNRNSLADSFDYWVKKEINEELAKTKTALEKLQDAYKK